MKLKKFMATVVCGALLVVGSGIPYPTAKADEAGSEDVTAVEDALELAGEKLAAPTNVRWEYGVAKWDAVEGAGYYDVSLYKGGDFLYGTGTSNTSYNFFDDELFDTYGGEAGSYTFKVCAITEASEAAILDESTHSDWSDYSSEYLYDGEKIDKKTDEKLPTPTNLRWDGTTCVWDSVDGAGFYWIRIKKDGEQILNDDFGSLTNSYDLAERVFAKYGSGSYSVSVSAFNTAFTYDGFDSNTQSDWSDYSTEFVNPAAKTVKFNANGGSGTMEDFSIGQYPGTFTAPECKFTAPEGKKFYAWKYISSEGFPDFVYSLSYVDISLLNDNTEFSAIWINSGKEYKINYDKGLSVTNRIDDSFGVSVDSACAGDKIDVSWDFYFAEEQGTEIPVGKYVESISYTGIDSNSDGFYYEYYGSSPYLSFIMPENDVTVSAVFGDTTNYTIDLSNGSFTTTYDSIWAGFFDTTDIIWGDYDETSRVDYIDIDKDGTMDIIISYNDEDLSFTKLDTTNINGSYAVKAKEWARPKYYFNIIFDKASTGEIENTTSTTENSASAALANSSDELKKAILTSEEQKLLEEGVDIKVWLDVDDISASVSETDKNTIEAAKPEGFIVGTFFDINLFKKIGDNDTAKITQVPNGNVKIQINVPENLQKSGRKYSIIRLHDGTATVLDTIQDGFVLTFETNQFSTYALVYSDVTATPAEVSTPSADTPKVTNNQSPKTGDNMPIGFMIVLMLGSLTVILRLKKKSV
ncbi:MAG: hypothetical protein IJ763_02450 [Lachnospiraceae bacterium]|nr:hypothetical protein [Lachnospiraceae bacterium]